MNARTLRFGGIELRADSDWRETTDEVEAADPPFTLTRDSGCGALQFTIGLYRSGRIPDPSPEDLLSMAREFGAAHHMQGPTDETLEVEGRLRLGAASYTLDRDFIRVWYASDGRSIAMVTYTCASADQRLELPPCESMVRSLCFTR